jgi:hypothetical protein
MRSIFRFAAVLALAAACGRSDGLDTKLSTELSNARFVVILWPPEIGSTTPSATQPAHTKCAMRLQDEKTGTFYVLSQSAKEEPPGGAGDSSTWPEHGDYTVQLEGKSSGASHRVRIDCGTWKVLGMVPARS